MMILNVKEQREVLQSIWWDVYKDAFGHRPRHVETSHWTVQDFKDDIEHCANAMHQNNIIEEQEQDEAADRAERTILSLLMAGARDREMAIRWLMEAHDAGTDRNYLCFLLGVRYGYFDLPG